MSNYEKDVYSVSDTGDSGKNPSSLNGSRTCDLLVTCPDTDVTTLYVQT